MQKMTLANVQKQTQETPRKKGGWAISSISVESETVCETNTQCQNTEKQKLEETIRLLTKEISDKDKKISEKEKTIDRMAESEKKMEKRDSEKSKETEKQNSS